MNQLVFIIVSLGIKCFHKWGTDAKLLNDLGTGWCTLSKAEWNYLLNERENAASLKAHATVNTVKGIVILPDAWTAPAGVVVTEGGTYMYIFIRSLEVT